MRRWPCPSFSSSHLWAKFDVQKSVDTHLNGTMRASTVSDRDRSKFALHRSDASQGFPKARATRCKTYPQIAAEKLAEIALGFERMAHAAKGFPRAQGVEERTAWGGTLAGLVLRDLAHGRGLCPYESPDLD